MPSTCLGANHLGCLSNKDYLRHAITLGYFGNHNNGRFVVYAPVASNISEHDGLSASGTFMPNIQHEVQQENNRRPETIDVVGAKFLYCFIDNKGFVWVNENYLLSDEPNFCLPDEFSDDLTPA